MKIKEITFEKLDGTIRTIRGTYDFKTLFAIKPELKPKENSIRKSSPLVKVFYDLDACSFKSYRKDKFVSERDVRCVHSNIVLQDCDFYNKNHTKKTIIQHRKTPYFILSFLSNNPMTKNELIEKMEYLSKKLNISKDQKRTVRRILLTFIKNGLVSKKDKYTITTKGINFISANV